MKVAKFKIIAVVMAFGGSFGIYWASNGKCVWTKDFGYQPGDQVEIHYVAGDEKPRMLFINGNKIDLI